MRTKTCQSLYSYWNEVRRGRLAPRRFDIEPSSIADILPETFILERDDTGDLRFRLAGTRICDQLGIEFRGRRFLDGWTAEDQALIRRQFELLAAQGGVGLMTVEATSQRNATAVFEVMVLPLTHTRETIDRFLGAWVEIGRADWLGREGVARWRLLAHDIVWPEGRPHVVVERMERQAPFLPHIRHARIVRSDRRQFRVYDGGLAKPEAK